ncbi:MAG: hypothetical protein KME06_21930 [Kastovskya adunca ATA6-11-RM4]|nr:hypothetical protein [Kastovskya adunca ATA6-11-RM4]
MVFSSGTVISSPVLAEVNRLNFILKSYGYQTFSSLIQQAESLAIKTIEQAFTQNSSITEVVVTIEGDHNGQVAPLLSVKGSRSEWQKNPQALRDIRYFPSSEVLLGFRESKPSQPTTTTTARSSSVERFYESLRTDPGFNDEYD